MRWSDGQMDRYPVDGAPNGLTFDQQGRPWFCDVRQNAIRRLHKSEQDYRNFCTMSSEVDGQPLNKPNDLAFDALGNLLFTCPGDSKDEPTGYICCLKLNGTVTKIADGLYFPNGLAFADRGHTLIVAETFRRRLWKGAWDAEGATWLTPKPWARVGGPSGPDGLAVSVDRSLYVAVFGTGQIQVVDASGSVSRAYDILGTNPTNVAFDPTGRLGLMVTEAEHGLLLSLPELGLGVDLFNGGNSWA